MSDRPVTPLDTPYTTEQIFEIAVRNEDYDPNEKGHFLVEGVIRYEFFNDTWIGKVGVLWESLLDTLTARLVGNVIFGDIQGRVVGHEGDTLFIEVSGMIDDDDMEDVIPDFRGKVIAAREHLETGRFDVPTEPDIPPGP